MHSLNNGPYRKVYIVNCSNMSKLLIAKDIKYLTIFTLLMAGKWTYNSFPSILMLNGLSMKTIPSVVYDVKIFHYSGQCRKCMFCQQTTLFIFQGFKISLTNLTSWRQWLIGTRPRLWRHVNRLAILIKSQRVYTNLYMGYTFMKAIISLSVIYYFHCQSSYFLFSFDWQSHKGVQCFPSNLQRY